MIIFFLLEFREILGAGIINPEMGVILAN